jgi:predicted DNA-binding protein (UPF0251 family)
MSAALVLPVVWATSASMPEREAVEVATPVPEVAFYRKYTEALLRRYVKLSFERGRAPSLLGKEEMFRGRVTHYTVQGFDDVVIFVHDVERCVKTLSTDEQYLVRRLAMEEYTQAETAKMMGLTLRTLMRRYQQAIDRLTRVFMERRILTVADM